MNACSSDRYKLKHRILRARKTQQNQALLRGEKFLQGTYSST
jgi:hypothetical protein